MHFLGLKLVLIKELELSWLDCCLIIVAHDANGESVSYYWWYLQESYSKQDPIVSIISVIIIIIIIRTITRDPPVKRTIQIISVEIPKLLKFKNSITN